MRDGGEESVGVLPSLGGEIRVGDVGMLDDGRAWTGEEDLARMGVDVGEEEDDP